MVTWIEVFTIFCIILCHTFPSRWKGLNQQKLLIIQTAGRFSDKSWLHYDIAFRKEAAASDSTNWSCMHPDLYNFHTRSPATTSVASGSSTFSALSLTESPASSGNCQSSQYWAGLLLYLLRSRVCQVLVILLFLRLPPALSPSSEADLGEGLRGLQPPFGLFWNLSGYLCLSLLIPKILF